MKQLVIFIFLFSISLNAQVYQTFSMHAVRVEGDLEAFEKVQSLYMAKVAQNAVDKGDIAFWAFLKRYTPDNIDDEERFNYLFVQSNTNISALLSDKNSWWNNANSVLTQQEQNMVEALSGNFTWTKDTRHVFIDEVSIAKGLGNVIQFNFARPKNLNGFISENKTLWKKHFNSNMSKMGMVNWGVGRKIAPLNQNTSTVVTWDMFNSLEELMQYRVGNQNVVNPALSKSKMGEYSPDGFSNSPIFIPIKFAVSQ